jgi:hypothetical protein
MRVEGIVRGYVVPSRSVTEDNGRVIFDTTKTDEARLVPLPRFHADQFVQAMAGKGLDGPVFEGARGGYLRTSDGG